jgi:hypothetical protein
VNTAVGRGHRGQQRGPAGEHGAEGGKRATDGFALAAGLLVAAVKIAGGLVTITDATAADWARAAANLALLASSVRDEER